ncbi:MAG: DUF2628 domain-containing protein [Clostridiales bacterium]|jgi:DNA-directed RNA polymerase subunit RPC12/RpoP|nr:DUF2628 domain-containing protein [Clostridiales bacterium]
MIDYTGLKCPVCGKTFTADDDIVVCPECGAPYHRECYTKAGKCVFADKHGTPDAWKPPSPQPDHQENGKRCPRCGSLNSAAALFCEHCGQPLTVNQQDFHGFPQNSGYPYGNYPPQNGRPIPPNQPGGFPQGGFPGQPIPFLFDPMGGVNPEERIEDVPAGEIAKLVQSNTTYYLPAFMNLSRFHRNRFNFGAFLFSCGWLLYRKMYKLGGILTAAMVMLYLASIYVSVHYSDPILQSLMLSAGVSSDSASLTYDQTMQVINLLMQKPVWQILLFSVPSIISLVNFVIMIVVGINANRWYLRHCMTKVRAIRESAQSQTEKEIAFQEQGGVNTGLALALLVCYMILIYLSAF